MVDQGGLADAGLAAHQHDAPMPAGRITQGCVKLVQKVVSLQEVYHNRLADPSRSSSLVQTGRDHNR
jgi:hypothetical protein